MKKTLSKLLLLVATAGLSLVSAANVRIICDYPITLKNVRASDSSLLGEITLEKDTWYSTNYDITQYWNISYDNKQCPELSTTQTLTAELDGYRCKGWYTLQSNDTSTNGLCTKLSLCNIDSPLAAGQKGQAAVSINLSEKLRYAKTSAYAYFYSDPPAAVICPLFVKAWTIKTSVSPEGMGETAGGGLIDDGDSTTLVASNPADGYRFVRWEKDGELVSENSTYKFDPTGDGTYTAVFALPPRDLTITASVSPEGKGTVAGGGACKEGDDIMLTATPTNGYAFAGWTNATGVISIENPWKFTATDDLVCAAAFTSRWYKVTFIDDDPTATTPEAVYRQYGEPFGILPESTYSNKYLSFTHWLDEKNGKVTAETILTNAAEQILHAAEPYERTEYLVIYIDSRGIEAPQTNRVKKGFAPTPPNWKSVYEQLEGWSPDLPEKITGDCTFTSRWTSVAQALDCMVLRFQARGNWLAVEDETAVGGSCMRIDGSSADESISTEVTHAGLLTFCWKAGEGGALRVTVNGKTGVMEYKSVGWQKETIEVPDAGDVSFHILSTELKEFCLIDNVSWTSTAIWLVRYQKGEFGTGDEQAALKTNGIDLVLAPALFERDGFSQSGWSVNAAGATMDYALEAVYSENEASTFYPVWTANVYTITFDPADGEGGPAMQRVSFGEMLPALEKSALPCRANHSFLGYFDAATGGKKYYGGDGASAVPWDKPADSTLYAQWQEDGKFTLTVESADETRGTVAKDPDADSYSTGEQVTISATANDGYAFEKWNDGATDSSRTVTVSGETAYTASFTACVYRVALNANGGTGGQAETWANYREKLPDLTQLPTKDGSMFNGYYDSATGGAMYYDAAGHGLANWLLADDAEIFAHWTPNSVVDVGEVSRVLDCDNLAFAMDDKWTICNDEWYYKDGEGNDGQYLETMQKGAALTTTITTSGTLTFYWCGGTGTTTLKVNADDEIIFEASNSSAEDNITYTYASVHVDVPVGSSVTLSILCSPPVDSYCDIDYLKWTPDAVPPPTGGATEVPSAIAGLIYDGNAQTGVVEGVNYTIVGNVATNAGTYTATVMLTNGEWTGGGTEPTNISWSIAKAQVVMSGIVFTNATYEADGEPKSIFVTGELPAGVTNVTYENNGQSEPGTYTVTAKFVVDGNHESVADKTATLTITAKEEPPTPPEPPEPVVTNEVPVAVHGLVYNGNAQTGVVAGVNYTIVGNVATNAGDYTATATVTIGVWEGGYAGPTNITWSIAKAAAPDVSGVTFAGATYEYDGESHSIAVSGTIPVGVEVIYSGETNRTEVGTNTVTVSFKVLDEANYEKIETTLTAKLIITAKEEPPTPPDPPGPAVTNGFVGFCASSVETAEGSNVVVEVFGGNTDLASSVQLQIVYNTAASKDLDLKNVKVDGIVQTSFKFPVTLRWPAGTRFVRVIEIPVAKDATKESDEFFTLQLKNPKNLQIVGSDDGDERAGLCMVTIRGQKGPSTSQWYARAVANDSVRGSVSGSKLCKKGTSVTFKATAATGYVHTGWFTNAVLVTTLTSWSFKMPARPVEAEAVFVPKGEDWLRLGDIVLPAQLTVGKSVKIVLPESESVSRATVKVTGLPAGLAYDASKNAITGKPTKTSSKAATVTVTVTNLSGYKIVRKYQLKVVKSVTSDAPAALVSESGPGQLATVSVNDELWGKVSGAGVFLTGATVTFKATAATGYVFTGWTTNGAPVSVSKASWSFKMPAEPVAAVATFRPIAEDYLSFAENFLPAELKKGVAVKDLYVPEPESLSQPTVTVSGLPSGLKYNASTRAITGKPKTSGKKTVTVTVSNLSGYKIVRKYQVTVVTKTPKAGYAKRLSSSAAYYALTVSSDDVLAGTASGSAVRQAGKTTTVKATAGAGYVFSEWHDVDEDKRKSQKASYSFTMPSRSVNLVARFVTLAQDQESVGATVGDFAFGASGEGMSTVEATVYCGVKVSWVVTASADSLPSVKVTGLPTGLAYKSGKISGVPTVASKAGAPSTIKVAVTTAGGAKKTFKIVLTVKSRESWARGTYTGKYVAGGVTNGTMTLTVATNGKISGKIVKKVNGKQKTTTLTASSIVRRTEWPEGDATYRLEPTYKSGKTSVKVPFELQLDPEGSSKGLAVGDEDGGMVLRQKQ